MVVVIAFRAADTQLSAEATSCTSSLLQSAWGDVVFLLVLKYYVTHVYWSGDGAQFEHSPDRWTIIQEVLGLV